LPGEKLASALNMKKLTQSSQVIWGRAKDTAKEIAKYHKAKIKYSKLSRKNAMGFLTDSHMKNGSISRNPQISPLKFRPKGGENYYDLKKRTAKFFNGIKASQKRRF